MVHDDKPELLIIAKAQFGYHVGTYYYCRFAAKHVRITYVGFDTGRPKVCLDGVRVRYVPYKGRKLHRGLRLLGVFTHEIKRHQGIVFIMYFPGCSVLQCLCQGKRVIVDIRTGSVSPSAPVRWWRNRMVRWECRFFRNVSVVSQSLADHLHLPADKTCILPLGGEKIAVAPKRFDRLDLLYVGTLTGRRIEDTIVGFKRFLQDYGARIALTYTIVGDGHQGQLEGLRRMVHRKHLDRFVRLPGYVHRTQLQETFDNCNVGISYVPINGAYDCQPVTKTFEYILAGMPVIATATVENKRVVNRLNGVLIQDTPESFYGGLEAVYVRRKQFNSKAIQRSGGKFSWDRIVNNDFVPYIQSICQS